MKKNFQDRYSVHRADHLSLAGFCKDDPSLNSSLPRTQSYASVRSLYNLVLFSCKVSAFIMLHLMSTPRSRCRHAAAGVTWVRGTCLNPE